MIILFRNVFFQKTKDNIEYMRQLAFWPKSCPITILSFLTIKFEPWSFHFHLVFHWVFLDWFALTLSFHNNSITLCLTKLRSYNPLTSSSCTMCWQIFVSLHRIYFARYCHTVLMFVSELKCTHHLSPAASHITEIVVPLLAKNGRPGKAAKW